MNSNGWTGLFRVMLPGSLTWRGYPEEKNVYITFDDGPTGPFTHEILDILEKYGAKATFFCVGDNVRKNPGIYDEILSRGQRTGNHTFHHLKGWNTPWRNYVDDVRQAAGLIRSDLFRPPYGKISFRQVQHLKKDYRIIMWSLLSLDYDPAFTAAQCLEILNTGTSPGEIVVFHDNLKAQDKVRYILPRYLERLKGEGYQFAIL